MDNRKVVYLQALSFEYKANNFFEHYTTYGIICQIIVDMLWFLYIIVYRR